MTTPAPNDDLVRRLSWIVRKWDRDEPRADWWPWQRDVAEAAAALEAQAERISVLERALEWRPPWTLPRDATVIAEYRASKANTVYPDGHVSSLPAYIDEDGTVCDAGTCRVDPGIKSRKWEVTGWLPLPAARTTLIGAR